MLNIQITPSTGRKIRSLLPGMELQGGKGQMIEAGTRVPFIAWWPGKIPAGKRNAFISLVDVLPTIASIAGIPVAAVVDGMDLSHSLYNRKGVDREFILMSYKKGFFIRDKRFRLHENGDFYDIPVTSNAGRYSEKISSNPEHQAARERMQKILDEFMTIKALYGYDGKENKKKKGDKKK